MKSPRRLAFVIHDLNAWGGHDRSTLEIARRLSHRWGVDIFSYSMNDPQGIESWGDVRFQRIGPDLGAPAVMRQTVFYGITLPAIEVLPRMMGEPRPLIHATGACSLVSDVVQVQFVNAAWQAKQKILPADVCAAPHARGEGLLKRKLRESYHRALLGYNVGIERAVYTRGKTYIAIAHCVARELEEHFGVTKNVHVIHHGVDSNAFAPLDPEDSGRMALRRTLGVHKDEILIAFVGAYERKGLAVAIDSIARLSESSRRRVKLMAVGGGSTEAFAKRAEEQGVGDRMVFAGHQKQITPYYQASDAFLLPSLYEPFGLVIIEALACGLPSVVSRLCGASELIRDGVSGKLIDDPTDPSEIALLLELLIQDDRARLEMAEAARAVALARSWDQVAQEYAAVLEPMLERP